MKRKRIGRLERPALMGVLVREIINFSSASGARARSARPSSRRSTCWRSASASARSCQASAATTTSTSSAPGTVATAVLFSSAFPGMFGTFVKYKFQRTYDAILAAPVDTEELVTAEALWIGIRAGTYGCAPMIVAMLLRAGPELGDAAGARSSAFIAGFGWANFGIAVAARMNSIDNFSYVISAVLTPLFLVAGTFFPIDGLPEWAQVAAQINPLYHLVQLVRDAVFGFEPGADLIHLAVLVAFGLLMWRLAVRWLAEEA